VSEFGHGTTVCLTFARGTANGWLRSLSSGPVVEQEVVAQWLAEKRATARWASGA
jgi:hypothetical protein